MGDKFVKGFQDQVNRLGLKLSTDDNIHYATSEDTYLSLEVLIENFGSSHLVFAQTTVILGNYQEALNSPDHNENSQVSPVETNNSSYDIYLKDSESNSQSKLSEHKLEKLEAFKALESKIYHDEGYLYFQQKGTHDLILKDPIMIEVLRGKMELKTVLDQLKQLDLPYGRYIQKPKGLGKKSVIRGWKITARILLIISIIFALLRLYML
ncbi:hypothetical protein [Reichenbachiella versicolor]|uniref:hypothetical protein n=1 Tax=Reichenbachiella versicolor TaxID=1821036 RepID=UPI0013A5B6BF|nr:hypothetical protein [Reichenbachiella versicolor]